MHIKQEIYRKLIHLSSAIYPLAYMFFIEREAMLLITGIIVAMLIFFEVGRKLSKQLRGLFFQHFSFLMRNHEEGGLLGSTHFMIAVFLTILIFPKDIAVCAILVLVVSDTLASICGKHFGKLKICEEKTVIGFMAFFLSASVISLFFNPLFVVAALFSAVLELYAKKLKIDDNFLIPLSFASVAYLLTSF